MPAVRAVRPRRAPVLPPMNSFAPLTQSPVLASAVLLTVTYMGQPLKLDYLWAALCMVGAVYFIFR